MDEMEAKKYLGRIGRLKTEYEPFINLHKRLVKFFIPTNGVFQSDDILKPDFNKKNISNSSHFNAVDIFVSGMMSGLTSPSRNWFELGFDDVTISKDADEKVWLGNVEKIMYSIFANSNFYDATNFQYHDYGIFGQSPIMMEETDESDIVTFHNFDVGSYYIGNNKKGIVKTFAREYVMRIGNLLEVYDKAKLPADIVEQYDENKRDDPVKIKEILQENINYVPDSNKSNEKQYISLHFINDKKTPIKEKYFAYFPVACPRWKSTIAQPYSRSFPGVKCINDVAQAQMMRRTSLSAINKQANPTLFGDKLIQQEMTSLMPGAMNFIDTQGGSLQFQKVFDIQYDYQGVMAYENIIENIIRNTFFNNVFTMISGMDTRTRTAREIEELSQEKMLIMGSALEKLNRENFDVIIGNLFHVLGAKNLLPEMPESLLGKDLKVTYISILNQAQKSAGLAQMDRFMMSVQGVSQYNPAIIDMIDFKKVLVDYQEQAGVNPDILLSTEAYEQILADRQAQEMQAQQMQMAEQSAKIGKDLSQMKVGDDKTGLDVAGDYLSGQGTG